MADRQIVLDQADKQAVLDKAESVRVALLRAYERLYRQGAITQSQFDEVCEVIGAVEMLPRDEVARRLGALLEATP